MLYRIITEKTDIVLNPIIGRYYDSYTIIDARGYWQDVPENSIVIEIVTDSEEDIKTKYLALEIKEVNGQESVLWLKFTEEHEFI